MAQELGAAVPVREAASRSVRTFASEGRASRGTLEPG